MQQSLVADLITIEVGSDLLIEVILILRLDHTGQDQGAIAAPGNGFMSLAGANGVWSAGANGGNTAMIVSGNPVSEPCEGDANGDGTVDPLDTGFVLARFGCPVNTGDPDCDTADQNAEGEVNPLDAGFVLSRFGPCD